MKSDRSVLLAEDDSNDVLLLQLAFQEAGIRNPLHVVHDGQEAIDYLSGTEKFSDRSRFPFPALLILDLKMPRKTGIDVLEWLAKEDAMRCLPTIMLSSSVHPGDIEKAYRLGVNAFVVKSPSTAQRTEFARMIKTFWLTLAELPLICTDGLEAAREGYSP
ncbi:MAG TPA: response regulator [Candidatus Angelobacter sp.]|nr:response regulator [Candidatus Angelobacter sp.]